MKSKLFTLLMLVSVSAFAQQQPPAPYSAQIFAEQGERFWVIINGVKQNTDPQTNVLVQGLRAPNYKMKIIFEDNNLPELDQNLFFNDPGEYIYNIKKNKEGKYVIRYNSFVPIAQIMPPPPGQTVIVYGAPVAPAPVGQTTVTTTTVPGGVVQQTTTTTTTGVPGDNISMGMNIGGVSAGVNINVSGMTGTTTYTETTTTTIGGNTSMTTTTTGVPVQQQIIYVPGYSGPIGCPIPMDAGAFANAKNSIANASFESTKQDMAKNIIGNNCFTAAQVREILTLFDFESTKLEIAKFAYSRTYDRGNYFIVNDVFDFDSSRSELSKFTGGY
jgi:hypothetical protein